MYHMMIALLIAQIIGVHSILIPSIANVTLVPSDQLNSVIVTNYTIRRCICLYISSFVAFNWYPNNSCQLFYALPTTYTIQSTPNARLFFRRESSVTLQ